MVIIGNALSEGMFRKVIQEHPLSERVDFQMVGGSFDEAIKVAKEYEAFADAFISGASITPGLRRRVRAPVVEVRIEGTDLLEAILKAYAHSPDEEIVVLLYGSPRPVLDDLAQVSDLRIRQVVYNSLEGIRQCVEGLARNTVKTIVAPTLPCLLAREFGIDGIPIYSETTLRGTIEEAAHLAHLHRFQKDLAVRLQAVGDFAPIGIVGTDASGTVTLANPMACDVLGTTSRAIMGKPVEKVLPGLDFTSASPQARPQIVQSVGKDLVVAVRRISADSATTGFVLTIHEARDVSLVEAQLRSRRARVDFAAHKTLEDVLGTSGLIQRVRNKAASFAKTDSTVLITGETGTGKELFAQGIHNASPRARKPFVSINCAALPETLLESELFGYEEGAFTGGKRGGKEGLLELAHTGTIFLDEIADLSPSAQAKLLRVLEEREMLRVGGRELIPVDVRVIAATNKDLAREVREGRFRSDLYYRISVLRLEVPPLRERPEDIPDLFSHFLKEHGPLVEARVQGLTPRVLPMLQTLRWPGNVRQLRAFVERLAALAQDGPIYDELLADLVAELDDAKKTATEPLISRRPGGGPEFQAHPLRRARNLSSDAVTKALIAAGGNKSRAAELLGVSRVTIWRKLRSRGRSQDTGTF
ncbi:MAG: sigma 54-interacting transcriptional regulator [Bacillota bacterium]|nr:sigma 54-interacting transcriptional regulator [Bacillota bacterium]